MVLSMRIRNGVLFALAGVHATVHSPGDADTETHGKCDNQQENEDPDPESLLLGHCTPLDLHAAAPLGLLLLGLFRLGLFSECVFGRPDGAVFRTAVKRGLVPRHHGRGIGCHGARGRKVESRVRGGRCEISVASGPCL